MDVVVLCQRELKSISLLLSDLITQYKAIDDYQFLRGSTVYAHDLPRLLRQKLNSFRLQETSGALLVRGYPVHDEHIGKTPAHWKTAQRPSSALDCEIFFFLCAALLGDPIAWATQQDGRIMHDVMPIRGHEREQLGSGSEELLTWHTEDAFHPLRTDYVGLMCLRNPDRVATTYASVEDLRLPPEILGRLREPRYPIRPDRSHLPQNLGGTRNVSKIEERLRERSYRWISQLDEKPAHEAVIFGDEESPYIRLDPYFMDEVYTDAEAGAALDCIVAEIDRTIVECVLEPGDILFLDNYKSVHGRVPFKARFDGTDRWLKRLNIARDLRKSRGNRTSAEERIIY